MLRRRTSARAASTRFAWFLALVTLLTTRAFAAPDTPREQRVMLAPGQAVVRSPGLDGRVETRVVDRFAPLRLIVQLDAPPALAARADAGGRERATRRVEASAERLAADLATLAAPMRAANGGPARAAVTRTYTQAFSGAAVTLEPSLLAKLRALPYVRGVWPDDTVRADLAQSVPLIRADQVRLQLGIDGTGVRVGIVDTGIDWTHPAFGGGFGPGHRVAAGWDFVHDDADPMDDHGHGTHVAGIVGGAGGGIVGVAPGVTFVAFKVLDANGYGYDSGIMAALDRVTDPDQDPGTDDGCRVINLSLGGGFGDPDDPMSQALDQLTDAGVVCCVAAGNSGPYSSTLSSPGSSRRAITVAATDKLDLLAYFSSRGPVPGHFDIKPDIAAPGVDIVSAALGGGTLALSGTSMATPHVAGVAALVRQYRPAWSADLVKAAIVEHAHRLPQYGPLEVGAGRLDALDAVRSAIAITPTNLAFGHVPTTAAIQQRVLTFSVHNLAAMQQTVTMPDSVVLAPGATLTFSPTVGTLLAGDSGTVTVTLTVDNTRFVAPGTRPFATAGTFMVASAADSVRLPASFHECAILGVTSSLPVSWLGVELGTGERTGAPAYSPPVPVAAGTYDVAAVLYTSDWPNRFTFVTREAVVVTDSTLLTVQPAEATTTFDFDYVDANGAPLMNRAGDLSIQHVGAELRTSWLGWPFAEIHINPSSAWRLQWALHDTDLHSYWHSIPGEQVGFGGSHTFTNSASDVHRVAMRLPAPRADSAFVALGFSVPFDEDGSYLTIGTWDRLKPLAPGESMPFDFQFAPAPHEGHVQLGFQLQLFTERDRVADLDAPQFVGPTLRLDRGWPLEVYDDAMIRPRWGTFGGSRMTFPVGLPVWRLPFANAGDSIRFSGVAPGLMHAFMDEVGSMQWEDDPAYTLRRNGGVIASGTVRGAGGITYRALPAIGVPGTGDVDFHAERPYTRIGRSASALVDAHLVLTSYSPNPPTLHSLQVLANDAPSDSIDFATAANPRVRLRTDDDGGNPPQVRVWVRGAVDAEWRPLAATNIDDVYEAVLPDSLDGAVELKVELRDDKGNTLAQSWSPAFFATRDPGTVPAGQKRVALLGAWPNPAHGDAVSLVFMLASNSPATIALYDVTGREILVQGVPSPHAGPQRIALDRAASLRPGLYFAKLAQGGRESHSRIVVIR